jgi:hypothetical protein
MLCCTRLSVAPAYHVRYAMENRLNKQMPCLPCERRETALGTAWLGSDNGRII